MAYSKHSIKGSLNSNFNNNSYSDSTTTNTKFFELFLIFQEE